MLPHAAAALPQVAATNAANMSHCRRGRASCRKTLQTTVMSPSKPLIYHNPRRQQYLHLDTNVGNVNATNTFADPSGRRLGPLVNQEAL
jgi:hypothetical protein